MFAEITNIVPPNACETVSGRYVDVVTPDPETIDIRDIAWAICRQARFAGHTISEEVYGVGQHSSFVEALLFKAINKEYAGVPKLSDSLDKWLFDRGYGTQYSSAVRLELRNNPRLQMGALIHDGTEAYLVDLPSPVKRHPALRTPYKELEAGVQQAIDTAFKLRELTDLEHAAITWADLMALQIEAAMLMPSRGRGWNGDLPVFEISFMSVFDGPMHWRRAYDEFMKRFLELQKALENELTVNR